MQRKRKIFMLVVCLMIISSILKPFSVQANNDDSIYEWKQGDSKWNSIYPATWSEGCAITAIAIQIAKSELVSVDPKAEKYDDSSKTGFNPGTFAKAWGISKDLSVNWNTPGRIVSGFVSTTDNYYHKPSSAGWNYFPARSEQDIVEGMTYFLKQGYFPIIEGQGSEEGKKHYVAVVDVTENDVIVVDPADGKKKSLFTVSPKGKNRWTYSSIEKHGVPSGYGSCRLYKRSDGVNVFDPCGGKHTAEYSNTSINKCMKCGNYNYSVDKSISIKNGSYVIIDQGTRLREGPYDNKTSVTVTPLPGGAEVQVKQAVNNVFGNTWYKVSYDGKTGFVFFDKLLYAGMKNPYSYGKYSSQLKSGSKGNSVKFLQQALNVVMNSGLTVDGQFGTNTKNAVKAFQKKYGLTQDGIYGKNSNSKMVSLLKDMGYGTDGKPLSNKETAEGHRGSSSSSKANTTPKKVILTYNAAGGSGAPQEITANENEKVTIINNTPSRNGYTFSGWSYTDGGNAQVFPGDAVTVDNNITLYAVWSADTYLITFDDNGGYEGPGEQAFRFGTMINLVGVIPQRDNYRFICWKDAASDNSFQPEDPIPSDWKDRMLIAQWEAAPMQTTNTSNESDTNIIENVANEINETVSNMVFYTVTYDGNGGNNVPEAQEQEIGNRISISDIIPSRDGYIFKGWSYSPDGTVNYSPNDLITENESITLYAVWEKEAPKEKNPYDYGSYSRQLQYKSSMMRGDDIKFLQQALNIVMNSGLDVDGIFGNKTKQAVKDFQSKYGLEVDGIYGKKSNAKMESLLSDLGYSK